MTSDFETVARIGPTGAGAAGADAEASVVPPLVVEMMIKYDRRAKHFDVIG